MRFSHIFRANHSDDLTAPCGKRQECSGWHVRVMDNGDRDVIAHYIGRWSQAQLDQLKLCEEIELLADKLPLHDVAAFGDLAARLDGVLDRVQTFEEQDLFPILEAMSPHIRSLLVTFRSHHARDREAARAVAAMLNLSTEHTARDLRDIKACLTSFAELVRRHVQFEEAITMALFASKRFDERRAVQ
jgi:hypothetical protein